MFLSLIIIRTRTSSRDYQTPKGSIEAESGSTYVKRAIGCVRFTGILLQNRIFRCRRLVPRHSMSSLLPPGTKNKDSLTIVSPSTFLLHQKVSDNRNNRLPDVLKKVTLFDQQLNKSLLLKCIPQIRFEGQDS